MWHNEKGFTGRQVQQAHKAMGKRPKNAPAPMCPVFVPPAQKAALTIADVFAAPPGQARDARIAEWNHAVWTTWVNEHDRIRALTDAALKTEK